MDDSTRRRFLKAAGATGVALATGPALARGQGGRKTTVALVGCAHSTCRASRSSSPSGVTSA
jgi:hypothetical protein